MLQELESGSMIAFNYIDRQKSAIGSSEKSQKVHSANWKEEVHLRKEVESLKKQEGETINRIFSDQRIVAYQFRRRMCRSIDLIKTHEKLKEDVKSFTNGRHAVDQNLQTSKYSKRSQTGSSPPATPFQRVDTFSGQDHNRRPRHLIERPVTASEKRGRIWESKIKSMTCNLQRAKSAPALRTNVSSNMKELNARQRRKTTATGQTEKRIVPISREQLIQNRVTEVAKQREAVLKFIDGIEHLRLQKNVNLDCSNKNDPLDKDLQKK